MDCFSDTTIRQDASRKKRVAGSKKVFSLEFLEEILMISMKKTALAAAMVMSLGTGVAQAAHVPVVGPVVQFSYAGTFTMLDPGGGFVGSDPALVGSMDMDMGTGAGHAR